MGRDEPVWVIVNSITPEPVPITTDASAGTVAVNVLARTDSERAKNETPTARSNVDKEKYVFGLLKLIILFSPRQSHTVSDHHHTFMFYFFSHPRVFKFYTLW